MRKRGNTVITLPFTIVISLSIIIIFGVFVVNMILPFVWYQKLQIVSHKYMYIIEKYGYLTSNEKNNLICELSDNGFDMEELRVDAPSKPREYGNMIDFVICYNYKQKLPSFEGGFKIKTKYIPMKLQKTLISKK